MLTGQSYENHSPDKCNSKGRKGKCRYCNEAVMWFTCDCGSRVPLELPDGDGLNEPLERHWCSGSSKDYYG